MTEKQVLGLAFFYLYVLSSFLYVLCAFLCFCVHYVFCCVLCVWAKLPEIKLDDDDDRHSVPLHLGPCLCLDNNEPKSPY